MAKQTNKVLSPKTPSTGFLAQIEKAFHAEPILFATSTRRPGNLFGAQIATDVLSVLGEHLDAIGKVERIALVLHTTGGALQAPWPIVNMLRSHVTTAFYVIVPEIALSAGTLIALGANKVFMLPHAFLSPVDPTGNWEIEGKKRNVSIEDVMGYVDFVAERVGIRDQAALVEALKELTKEIPATMLGSIHRTRYLIERLSTSLLQLHKQDLAEQGTVEKIVDFLTHSLHDHRHMIPYREAHDMIGLDAMVQLPDRRQEKGVRAAHEFIKAILQVDDVFEPEDILPPGDNGALDLHANRAILISRVRKHAVTSKYRISRSKDGQIQVKPSGIPCWQPLK